MGDQSGFDIQAAGTPGPQGLAGERPIYATYAALALITGSIGASAEVPLTDTGSHTDPVSSTSVANSGIYSWDSGASGWHRICDTDALSAKPYADAAERAAERLSIFDTVGLVGTPVDKPQTTSTNTIILDGPAAVADYADEIEYFGTTPGTGTIRCFTRSGTFCAKVGPDYTFPMVAGHNFHNPAPGALPRNEGEEFAFYGPGLLDRQTGLTGVMSTTPLPGNVTTGANGTSTDTVEYQIKIKTVAERVTSDDLDAVHAAGGALADVGEAIEKLTGEITQRIGRSGDTVPGGAMANKSIVFGQELEDTLPLDNIELTATEDGTLKVRRVNSSGDVHTADATVSVPFVAGKQTLDMTSFDLVYPKGSRFGFTAGGKVAASSPDTDDGGGYFSVDGDFASFTDATLTTGVSLQIAANFKGQGIVHTARDIAALKDQVAELGSGGFAARLELGGDQRPIVIGTEGDSVTSFGGPAGNNSWPGPLAAKLGVPLTNFALSGSSIDAMAARAPTGIHLLLSPDKRTVIFFLEWLKQAIIKPVGTPASDLVAAAKAYADDLRAAGFGGPANPIGFFNCPSWNTVSDNPVEGAWIRDGTTKNAINAILGSPTDPGAYWHQIGDFMVDLASMPELQNYLDTTYYLDERSTVGWHGIHWTDLAEARVARRAHYTLSTYLQSEAALDY